MMRFQQISRVSSETLEEVEKSNLSKKQIFDLIDEINKLDDKTKDIIDSDYIKTKLLKYNKDSMRYYNLALELSSQIKANRQIKITVDLIIKIIIATITDYIR